MRVIYARNVNDAWAQAVQLMLEEGRSQKSRAGDVLVMPCPVMTVYSRPTERVLFDPYRDANPFFHLFESLWMLAGRNDAAFLNRFISTFGERFAEPNMYIHGGYGYRWRYHFGFDQLEAIISKLKKNPDDRQVVLQMWDAGEANDLIGEWKDRPCNTHCYFRRRNGFLDMTVLCRSNDILWGAYGANAVHFSVLQEYLAGRIGCEVGVLYQFSNNWHAYEATFKPYVEKSEDADEVMRKANEIYGLAPTYPMGVYWDDWDSDLATFMSHAGRTDLTTITFRNQWFRNVAEPLFHAHTLYREKRFELAISVTKECLARDWRIACEEWIVRRINRNAAVQSKATG